LVIAQLLFQASRSAPDSMAGFNKIPPLVGVRPVIVPAIIGPTFGLHADFSRGNPHPIVAQIFDETGLGARQHGLRCSILRRDADRYPFAARLHRHFKPTQMTRQQLEPQQAIFVLQGGNILCQ
jgi:hypothetical protein